MAPGLTRCAALSSLRLLQLNNDDEEGKGAAGSRRGMRMELASCGDTAAAVRVTCQRVMSARHSLKPCTAL